VDSTVVARGVYGILSQSAVLFAFTAAVGTPLRPDCQLRFADRIRIWDTTSVSLTSSVAIDACSMQLSLSPDGIRHAT